jgi:hypothetical protein
MWDVQSGTLEAFAKTITGQHAQAAFLQRVKRLIAFVGDHPQHIGEIGVIGSLTGGILVNHKIFSAFLGLKPNSLSRNFRDHNYVLDPQYDPSRELLARVPVGSGLDTRKWALRRRSIEGLERESAPNPPVESDEAGYDAEDVIMNEWH